jgi:hypothetical protein
VILLIRIFTIILILISKVNAQFLPTSVGVHHKKLSSVSDESFATLLQDGAYGTVTYSNTMSTYSVSLWVKSRDLNPVIYNSAFSTYYDHNAGFQIDSDGNYSYRVHAYGWNTTFGSNTLKTTWVHLAVVADGSTTKLYYNGSLSATKNGSVMSDWNGVNINRNRNADRPGDYYLDEIRVWEGVALTQANIQAWMHKPLDNNHPNFSDLLIYFPMNSDDISGTSLSDASGNNNDAILNLSSGSVGNATSYVPVVDLISGYQNNVEAIWTSTGDYHNDSDASAGLSMSLVSPSSALAEANFVVYGNNGIQSSSSSSILGLSKLSDRVWQFDETGTVSADIKIDIGTSTGYSGGATLTASSYKLLYKSCSLCDYSIEVSGSSISSTDNITFSSVAIKDGFYSIGSTDNNL